MYRMLTFDRWAQMNRGLAQGTDASEEGFGMENVCVCEVSAFVMAWIGRTVTSATMPFHYE